MGLKLYRNKQTGEEKRSLKKLSNDQWDEILVAPNQKYMISANASTGTSKMKNSEKILKSRARSHSRDVLGDDTIQINIKNGLHESVAKNLLNTKGEKRRKIDDI